MSPPKQLQLRILHEDPHFIAIDKPAGFVVHPLALLSRAGTPIAVARHLNCLAVLRDYLGSEAYPIHRLDRPTSGVLIYGKTSEAAGLLARKFQDRKVQKIYLAVVRGHTKEEGIIEEPLCAKDALGETQSDTVQEAITHYSRLCTIEVAQPVGRYPTARYSLLWIEPKTGRHHQIRRHFDHLGYPLLGDTTYGDSKHNRFFREGLGIQGLLLKAWILAFENPIDGQKIILRSRYSRQWRQVLDLFGYCPWKNIQPQ
jgi:tRNA pseudouridine65 synthase